MRITQDDVNKAVSLPDFDGTAAQLMMMPAFRRNVRPIERDGQPRLGSVLLFLYRHEEELYLLLTRRREDLNSHAGQISFPGGRCEDGETFRETALRETFEEIGVYPSSLQVLGELTSIYILPSDFEVRPFVGWYREEKRPLFRPSQAEVAQILEVPLAHLLDPANRKEEPWTIRNFEMDVPFFDFHGHKIWGATAMMLSEFLERLRVVGYE